MTVTEFRESINEWWELKSFCSDNDCDLLDEVYDDEGVDSYIEDRLYDMTRYNTWRETRDFLNTFDDSYDGYYYLNDYGEFEYLDMEDFDRFKADVEEWALNDGCLEYDDEEDEEDEEDEGEYKLEPDCEIPDDSFEPADFAFDEMYMSASVVLNTVRKYEEEANTPGNLTELIL